MINLHKIFWKFFQPFLKFSNNFIEIFWIFFQKLPSACTFINCTNLSKFVKTVFIAYLNFTKLSNISEIFWRASTKSSFWKIYTSFINNLLKFFKNVFKNFQNFRDVFPNISLIFFSKFQHKLLKINTFF